MHTATITLPFTNAAGTTYPPGKYVVEDVTASEWLAQGERGSVHLEVFPCSRLSEATEVFHATHKRILLISNAGYGDVLMLTPAIRAFAKKYPQHFLVVCCPKKTHVVLEGMGAMFAIIDYPYSPFECDGFDAILTTEHLQESAAIGREKHAIDIKADVLGVGPLTDDEKKVHYVVTDAEKEWALKEFPRKEKMRRIGLHVNTSGPTRTPHPQWITNLIDKLWDHEDWEIVCMGTAEKFDVPPMIQERVRSAMDRGYSFRETAAILSTCEIAICPDSALIHVCGALDIPAVGVFAVVPWQLRTESYPKVKVLQGHAPCAPCFFHPRNGGPLWPVGKPCAKLGYCEPLSQIEPARVVREVEKMLS